ncbi:MAG: hypothetical protein ACKVT1_13590 [Dehalococcoidia bacterium]
MPEGDVHDRLEDLRASPRPLVARFDGGQAFAGRVAILPSAFNPPTAAHFRLLALAASLRGIEATAALLTTANVDKGLYGAPLAHRVGMLLAGAAGEPARPAVLATNRPRFVDQAAALRTAFPGAGFDFIAGHDTLVRIFDRKYYEDMPGELGAFFANHRLIATNRGLSGIDEVVATLRWPEAQAFADRIVVLEIDAVAAAMSSSAARAATAAGTQSEAIPDAVRDYINEHGLYREHAEPTASGLFPGD